MVVFRSGKGVRVGLRTKGVSAIVRDESATGSGRQQIDGRKAMIVL
jgi:hypothetical protein